MAGVSFQLEGIRNLEAVLERAAVTVRAQIAAINRQTAVAVQARAQALAPRDRGDLRRAIAVQGKDLSWRVGLADATIPSRGGRNRAHQNPSVYGVWYEFGFVTRHIRRQPFMRPAMEAETPRYQDRLNAAARNVETTLQRTV